MIITQPTSKTILIQDGNAPILTDEGEINTDKGVLVAFDDEGVATVTIDGEALEPTEE